MAELEYLTDQEGQLRAVVVPVALWQRLFPPEETTSEDIMEAIENYCLSRAMDEANDSPLLNRADALAFLEE